MGRAALALAREGIETIFGDEVEHGQMVGLRPRVGGWTPVRAAVRAIHDRFPSQVRAVRYAAARAGLDGVPLANPPSLTLLCRDKVESQRLIETRVAMPELETDPARFLDRLSRWGAGFLKPRHGALGRGVRRVVPGDPLPYRLVGMVPGRAEPAVLQRAVPPPAGWAGWSIRLLCQRLPGGGWWQGPLVVRRSRSDPVVNAARGAEVVPGDDVLPPETRSELARRGEAVCAILADQPQGDLLVELGLDFVVDTAGAPHLIEVNSRPRGRLEALAALDPDRYMAAHVEACARPIRYLAALTAP